MHSRGTHRSAERAALIYCQTAQLLEHSSRFAGSIKGNGVGREALRLLAERLAATCLLRNTALHTQRYADCAGRALSALKEQHRQQAQAQAAGERVCSTMWCRGVQGMQQGKVGEGAAQAAGAGAGCAGAGAGCVGVLCTSRIGLSVGSDAIAPWWALHTVPA